MAGVSIEPFHLNIAETEIEDLHRRLRATRWPSRETLGGWKQGVPVHIMKDFTQYWLEEYDWRKCEAWFNSVPQFMADIDGMKVHFLHIRSKHPDALPMMLIHGWPGSVLEFRKVIAAFTNPEAHGGSAKESFHLVIPSMPGYGFSDQPEKAGFGVEAMSKVFVKLMEALGYKKWVSQGVDWGSDISAFMASQLRPPSLVGVHMNTAFFNPRKEISANPTREEQDALDMVLEYEKDEHGYFKLHATRPQTVGYALADSPVGQAAWILEKFYAWSQHTGDVFSVHSKEDLLDNIMLYWLTNSGASSGRLYWEDLDTIALPISIPVGLSIFPGDHYSADRSWGERYYENIVHWRMVEIGGHFASLEVPEVFVREVRECFSHVR